MLGKVSNNEDIIVVVPTGLLSYGLRPLFDVLSLSCSHIGRW
jgi:hypothetical protein